jgi:hypothetical protein
MVSVKDASTYTKGPQVSEMKFNARIEPPNTLTADHVVALNVRIFRKVSDLSMKQLGEQLEQFTGKAYSPQSINYWEQSAGKERARPCSAQELVGLSRVLNVPVPILVTVPEDDRWMKTPVLGIENSVGRSIYVQFTDGHEVAKAYLDNSGMLVAGAMINSWTIREAVDELGVG